jgi:hypothetical protein
MKETILRANDALYLACIWVAGMSIFVMSLIIPWGIFTRYVLGSGSQWPEPIAILLMVVFTFWARRSVTAPAATSPWPCSPTGSPARSARCSPGWCTC